MREYMFGCRADANLPKLSEEISSLFATGKIAGLSNAPDQGLVIIYTVETLSDELIQIIRDVIAAHDPSILTQSQIIEAAIAAVQSAAPAVAESIPGWARWTEQQAIDYITASVTDLASARTVLIAMARLLIALRNAQWPWLEAGQ